MIHQLWFEYGSVFGMRYLFEERGEGLAMHSHAPHLEHNVIVLKGAIQLSWGGAGKLVHAPAIIEVLPSPHEIAAWTPGTEILNLYKHGKPPEYEGLPDEEKSVVVPSQALKIPLV